jgi:hypothetical protein
VRDEWAEELLKESRAAEVRNYVRELEEHLRWKDFALRSTMQNDLKKLLGCGAVATGRRRSGEGNGCGAAAEAGADEDRKS